MAQGQLFGQPLPGQVIPLIYIDTNQLVGKTEADQKQLLGNYIYPFVEQSFPAEAGKITGMLLQKSVNEILAYCANKDLFVQTIQTANAFLQQAAAAAQQTQPIASE